MKKRILSVGVIISICASVLVASAAAPQPGTVTITSNSDGTYSNIFVFNGYGTGSKTIIPTSGHGIGSILSVQENGGILPNLTTSVVHCTLSVSTSSGASPAATQSTKYGQVDNSLSFPLYYQSGTITLSFPTGATGSNSVKTKEETDTFIDGVLHPYADMDTNNYYVN